MNLQTSEGITSKPNHLKDFIQKIKNMDFWNELQWPVISTLILLRPLHFWLMEKVVKIEKGDTVLEIGSGVLPYYKFYADKVGESGLFVAVDINANIQKRSKKICYWIDKYFKKKDASANIIHQVADVNKLPFEDGSFNLVLANNFNGGDTKSTDIKEVFRALRPGGRVIYTWDEALSIPADTALQAKMCKKVGFDNIKIRPGAPGAVVPGLGWNWYMEATKPIFKK